MTCRSWRQLALIQIDRNTPFHPSFPTPLSLPPIMSLEDQQVRDDQVAFISTGCLVNFLHATGYVPSAPNAFQVPLSSERAASRRSCPPPIMKMLDAFAELLDIDHSRVAVFSLARHGKASQPRIPTNILHEDNMLVRPLQLLVANGSLMSPRKHLDVVNYFLGQICQVGQYRKQAYLSLKLYTAAAFARPVFETLRITEPRGWNKEKKRYHPIGTSGGPCLGCEAVLEAIKDERKPYIQLRWLSQGEPHHVPAQPCLLPQWMPHDLVRASLGKLRARLQAALDECQDRWGESEISVESQESMAVKWDIYYLAQTFDCKLFKVFYLFPSKSRRIDKGTFRSEKMEFRANFSIERTFSVHQEMNQWRGLC
ncbi:hypothetical protein BKA70DRAFT_1396000 [Coprinopsis sp. MPI-PUGE-AT-0042]|nr:hypothetical protein BKA70DRAFT_1396000 [Coprinopsis sp. MPI-PUGE-AT-0042]